MATQRQLDRFKLSLAVVDVVGIITFFWTGQWLILVYLALFNFLIMLIDVIRRGMIVHNAESQPALPDEIPVDPDTGNLYAGDLPAHVAPRVQKMSAPNPELNSAVRNTPAATPFARTARAENPFEGVEREVPIRETVLPRTSGKDPQREEIEQALEEWVSK